MADDTALGVLEEQAAGTYTGTETVDAPGNEGMPIEGAEDAPIDGAQPIEGAGGEGGEGAERTERTGDELPPYEEVKEFTPKQVYETIRHLREEHADDPTTKRVLHSMTDAYGRLQGFITEFPEGVTQAREAKAILDSFGGFDGIAELEDAREVADEARDQIRRGDPAFVQDIAQAAPQGFAKLVPEAIKILQTTNSQAYETALLGPTLKQLENAGLGYALDQALKELKSGSPDGIARAGDWIQRTMGWHQQLQQKFDESQKYSRDPRLPELERERAGLAQTQRNAFLDDVNRRLDEYMRESFRPQIQQKFRGRTVSKEAMDDLLESAMMQARDSLAKNNVFASRVKAYARNNRNPDAIPRAMGVIKAQVDSVRKNSIDKVWTTRYGSIAPQPAARPGAQAQPRNGNPNQQPIYSKGAGSSPQNPLKVKEMPKQADIDMSKDLDRNLLFAGRAYVKSIGKWVAWR